MDILGDVNNGWFARLAHGCEYVSGSVMNFFSPGSGDRFYQGMANNAQQHVDRINQNAIDAARRNGATEFQALQAGSNRMEELINPQNGRQLVRLFDEGSAVATSTVLPQSGLSDLGTLTPLLIGLGVLGVGAGAYVLSQ